MNDGVSAEASARIRARRTIRPASLGRSGLDVRRLAVEQAVGQRVAEGCVDGQDVADILLDEVVDFRDA